MSDTRSATDMGVGLALAFGALAVVASLLAAATSYVVALEGDHAMQVASGLAIATAMLFAGLAVTALHRFGE